MEFNEKIFRFRVAFGIVLKELRTDILVNGKTMTQEYLNNDILEKYNKTWNSAREETYPNLKLENLFLVCDYFKYSSADLLKLVNKVQPAEIDAAIINKRKLTVIAEKMRQQD